MKSTKEKIITTVKFILGILLIFYFVKALWINMMSYDKVQKVPRSYLEEKIKN